MKLRATAALAFCLAFTACGGGDAPAENTAQTLEEAAEQSSPEAAASLENSAEQVREQNIADPAAADRALKAAGNAQAPQAAPPPPASNGQ